MMRSVATSFTNSISSKSLMFNNCSRLVGGADGFVPSNSSGGTVCKLGTGGVLTNPIAASRERHHRVVLLLQLQCDRGWQRYGVFKLEDELHVHADRCGRAGALSPFRPDSALPSIQRERTDLLIRTDPDVRFKAEPESR